MASRATARPAPSRTRSHPGAKTRCLAGHSPSAPAEGCSPKPKPASDLRCLAVSVDRMSPGVQRPTPRRKQFRRSAASSPAPIRSSRRENCDLVRCAGPSSSSAAAPLMPMCSARSSPTPRVPIAGSQWAALALCGANAVSGYGAAARGVKDTHRGLFAKTMCAPRALIKRKP